MTGRTCILSRIRRGRATGPLGARPAGQLGLELGDALLVLRERLAQAREHGVHLVPLVSGDARGQLHAVDVGGTGPGRQQDGV